MAIIDKITGYYGFTIDIDPENPATNNNGEVKTCLIAFTFSQQTSDVDVTVSQGEDDFAVKTGDGQIIPCRNPKVIYTNRDNAIVQFDMEREYPANSPLSLVYHSNTAKFTIDQRANGRPFEVNSVSGHFAYTVEGYKGSNIADKGFDGSDKYTGLVNKVMATVPFKYSPTAVRAELSQGENDWGIRMGNGQVIPLKDPEVVTVNQNNFIALFTMHDGYSYPSNSPGILVYRSANAKIEVIPQDDDHNFYPVRNIYDVPASMISGQTIDLNCAKVEPFNASVQHIDWSVVSGPGEIIDGHYLHATKGGSIIINGTIENGLEGDDLSNDYFQRFTIEIVQNVITKLSDPIPEIKAYVGEINHTIAVVAESSTDHISYQWYHNNIDSYTDATLITKDGNNASYVIPENLAKGDHYYFCKIMSDGAADILSAKCHIYASIRCTSITIYPLDNAMGWESSRQMYIVQYPSDADLPDVKWFSSNDNIAKFDETIDPKTGLLTKPGLLHSKFPEVRKDGDELTAHDTVTITAVTTDILGEQLSASIDIMIHTFVPVTDITGLKLDLTTNNSYKLSGTVEPADATNKDIVWTVVNSNNTDVNIVGDLLNIPSTVIPKDHLVSCTIRATIENGSTTHNKFQKEFSVFITHGFIPVTDIILNTDNTKLYDSGVSVVLKAAVLPTGSSINDISWSLISGGAELHGNTLMFNTAGNIVVRATVHNGGGTVLKQVDFSKDFTFKCSGNKYTPVSDASIYFDEGSSDFFNPFGEKFNENTSDMVSDTIGIAITPEDSTVRAAKIEYINIQFKEEPENYHDPDFVMSNDFWTSGFQTMKDQSIASISNNTLTLDRSKIITGNIYLINTRITITKGLSSTEDFIVEKPIHVMAEDIDPFVPVEKIELKYPNIMRACYPIMIDKYTITPFEATEYDSEQNKITTGTGFNIAPIPDKNGENGCSAQRFYGATDQMGFTVPPLNIFDLNLPAYYLYPWNPGKLMLTIYFADCTVPNINSFNKYYPEKSTYIYRKELEFLPPFIPVDRLTNIPSEIQVNEDYILGCEAITNNGLGCYNPAWDEETPTYTDVTYSIIENNCGASLTGNILRATSTGTVKIRATVDSGLAEYISWYGKEQQKVDFVHDFTINAVSGESEFSRPIVTLTFTDNSTLEIKKLSQIKALSTHLPSNSIITLNGKAFRKDQVKNINFYENIHNDLSVSYVNSPISTIEFDESDTVITLNNDINSDPFSVSWEITSGVGVTLTSNDNNSYAHLNIDHSKINVGSSVKVKCTVKAKKTDGTEDKEGKVEREVEFKKVASRLGAWAENPNLTTLENFGRNFTNLLTINRIPDEVNGNACLKNFLRGCTSFNSNIIIHEGLNGFECLMNFLKDCSSFNSNISIPSSITGYGVMHGFLSGCTHFNRVITLPAGLTGESCLRRFLFDCEAFNQPLSIPSGVSGYYCMFEFMQGCKSFNQPLTLPTDVGNFMYTDPVRGDIPCGMQLCCMLHKANSFHSTITVPEETGKHAQISEKTLASYIYNSNMITYGVTLTGTGANNLLSRFTNFYEPDENGDISWPPYRHITNLD